MPDIDQEQRMDRVGEACAPRVDVVSMTTGEGFGFLSLACLLLRLMRGEKLQPAFRGCCPDTNEPEHDLREAADP